MREYGVGGAQGLSCFKYNEPFCWGCMGTMDNLRKICGRQHGSDWYNAQRGDPEKAKYLIEHFRNHKKAVEIGDVSEKWAVAMAKTELATEKETEISTSADLLMWSSEIYHNCEEYSYWVRV